MLNISPSPVVTVYTRVKASFTPNKMPLKLIKYFVKDAQLIK